MQAGVNRPASTNFQPSYNSPISSAQYENQKLNSKISNRNQDKIPDTNPIIQEDKITQHYSTIEKGSIIQRIDNFPNGQYGSGGQLSSQNIPLNSPNRPLKYPNNGSPYNPQAGVNYQDNRNQNYNGGGLLNTSKRPSITDRPANEGIEPSRENVNQSPKNKQKYPTLNAPDRNRQDNAGTRPIPTSYEDSEPIREYQNQFNRNKLQTTNFPREPKPENFEPVTDFAWRFFKVCVVDP